MRGWLVAFDYGHPARILYHPFARPEGTLAVHIGGRRGGDPLEDPGHRDITAHVNWDVLLAAGEAEGLRTLTLARQGMYLTEAGIFDFARATPRSGGSSASSTPAAWAKNFRFSFSPGEFGFATPVR